MKYEENPFGYIHNVLYGYPAGEKEPKSIQAVKKIADAMGDLLIKQGPKLRRQVTIEGQKAGMVPASYPYLYYTLDIREQDWPPMRPSAKRRLSFVRTILADSGEMPAYRHLLQTPTAEQEPVIDQTLLGLAEFCVDLEIAFLREYTKLVKKNLWFATADPRIEDEDDLNRLVVSLVKRNPGRYSSGLVTKAFFDSLFDRIV